MIRLLGIEAADGEFAISLNMDEYAAARLANWIDTEKDDCARLAKSPRLARSLRSHHSEAKADEFLRGLRAMRDSADAAAVAIRERVHAAE